MDKEMMGRVCKWFNVYMCLFDYSYSATVESGKIKISDIEIKDKEPYFYDNIIDIINDYFDLLLGDVPVDSFESLAELEDKLYDLVVEGKEMITEACCGLVKIRELRTVTEFNEYWKVA